ncbi:MAG: alanine racemase, partial [Flavobacteriaceae bacterium]
MQNNKWYALEDTQNILSPSLLIYPERIEQNIRTMISMAGGTKNLRPHIKTYKTAEIIKMQLALGIRKFKCATIAEAELLAICGAADILLAMQPIGANMGRFFTLMETYRDSKFSALVDDQTVLDAFIENAKSRKTKISLWMDINNGMNRTGIAPNTEAFNLFKSMASNPEIEAKGLHVYDGHIRSPNHTERKKNCDEAFKAVLDLKTKIETEGFSMVIIAGGSPSFQFHAIREGVETSPGTTLLWDAGYGGLFPELDFL